MVSVLDYKSQGSEFKPQIRRISFFFFVCIFWFFGGYFLAEIYSLLEFYQIAKRDNSRSIFENLNPKTDTFTPKSPLKVHKSDPRTHIFNLYSLRPIQIRNPKISRQTKMSFLLRTLQIPNPWKFWSHKFFQIGTVIYRCYVRISRKTHWKLFAKTYHAWFQINIETPMLH